MNTPTLIDMPEPPSPADTPTEAPGTPNSTTTSLSTLSTTAIKDGHRGNALPYGHHHSSSSNTLEAERADRISRLAGLERVSAARPQNPSPAAQIPGYFDAAGNPVYTTKMSTVGSASATGSTGGRTTTWASTSQKGEDDEMSMDTNYRDMDERDRYSAQDEDMDQDGMSDDTSLVGFGEGAGSTVSGPTYSRARSGLANQLQREESGSGSRRESGAGTEAAERMTKGLDEGEGGQKKPPLGSPDEAGLGKFYFEEGKK